MLFTVVVVFTAENTKNQKANKTTTTTKNTVQLTLKIQGNSVGDIKDRFTRTNVNTESLHSDNYRNA